ETWFGYLKNDGFEKRKHRGRIDFRKRWETIKQDFLQKYRNRKEVAGLSVQKLVRANDEWIAEAYLETDYSTLSRSCFEEKIKDYVSFKVRRSFITVKTDPVIPAVFNLDI